ncbi:hypothetical protein PFTANZ_03598 [Plasmodium falciparum Tanzania (2000708)]|uniref:Sporozoite and liver stage asparagine-rich protein n=1 Tax=Plasmodium falciparum Tanzania (2000708) TaxID=1036725 RepID=A0A024W682_PLAFA|nr:hypothetical protein PFTANZ_03598 [Plasmodium falciparum Tanzania (2000708)]
MRKGKPRHVPMFLRSENKRIFFSFFSYFMPKNDLNFIFEHFDIGLIVLTKIHNIRKKYEEERNNMKNEEDKSDGDDMKIFDEKLKNFFLNYKINPNIEESNDTKISKKEKNNNNKKKKRNYPLNNECKQNNVNKKVMNKSNSCPLNKKNEKKQDIIDDKKKNKLHDMNNERDCNINKEINNDIQKMYMYNNEQGKTHNLDIQSYMPYDQQKGKENQEPSLYKCDEILKMKNEENCLNTIKHNEREMNNNIQKTKSCEDNQYLINYNGNNEMSYNHKHLTLLDNKNEEQENAFILNNMNKTKNGINIKENIEHIKDNKKDEIKIERETDDIYISMKKKNETYKKFSKRMNRRKISELVNYHDDYCFYITDLCKKGTMLSLKKNELFNQKNDKINILSSVKYFNKPIQFNQINWNLNNLCTINNIYTKLYDEHINDKINTTPNMQTIIKEKYSQTSSVILGNEQIQNGYQTSNLNINILIIIIIMT